MLSKYSVRKPYTVVVAVILTLVLGVISFLGMKTDLLPSVELPYVVVITPYPGASPEKVEQLVTEPMERGLGTASGLNSLQSVSGENSSMIILEYVEGTNMDSAMIELSGTIDQVKGTLEEGIGSPILLKLSPDMLPIFVASVDVEGMELDELSRFTEDIVMPSFERQEGVAAVTASGLVEDRLEIVLVPEKIAALNKKIIATVETELDEAKSELLEARASLVDGQKTMARESSDQKEQIAKASTELSSAISNLNALIAEEASLTAEKAALEATRDQLRGLLDFNALFERVFPQGAASLTQADLQGFLASIQSGLPDGLLGAGAPDDPGSTVHGSTSADPSVTGGFEQFGDLDPEDLTLLLEQAREAVRTLIAVELDLQSIKVRQMTIAAMKPSLEKGLKQATGANEKLEAGKITMAVELAKAEVQMQSGLTEIDRGLAAFDAQREEALAQSDLAGILTEEMIANILKAQNFSMPAGYLKERDGEILIKVGDDFATPREIDRLVLFSMEPVGDIELWEVADVAKADNSAELYTKVNGNNGVLLTFQKQSTASTAQVSDAIDAEITDLEAAHPGLRIRPMMDQGDYIDTITDNVMQNLLLGGLLAILVLILFLRDLKPTFVIALSIPISLTFALVLMYFSGVTLNVISLSGLALGVGMLVDNSIVVIENIYRLRKEGMPADEAAIEGAREVSGAIVASTLTTVSVFLPIVFTQGISRQLFTDMGLTIAYSLLASLLVALTLVPSMGATILRKTDEKQHRWFDSTVGAYERALGWTLHFKPVVLLVAVSLLGLSIFGVTRIGTAFIPEIDSSQMSATFKAPDGLTAAEVNALNDDLMERILAIEAVETVGVMGPGSAGFMGFGPMGGRDSGDASTIYILLRDERAMTNRDVEAAIYATAADLGGDVSVSASNMDLSALGGSGIAVDIKGFDLDVLAGIARDVAVIARETAGTEAVLTGLEDAGEEIRITVDKDKAIVEGLTVAQVFAEVSAALSEELTATQLTEAGTAYPVVLLKPGLSGLDRTTLGDLSMDVTLRDGTEKTVVLDDIADVAVTESVRAINRTNQARYMTVSAGIAEGYNIGLVSREFEANLEKLNVPTGYEVTLAGENETIRDTMRDLVLMILLAIVFIYLIMVAQFQDLLSPFIVLFTLPLAFTGGFLLLYLAGMELSVIAMLGFLVLAGVVVNNGIVFVDYANQLRARGIAKHDALIRGGATRLRPILMTALTTILAMVTLALGYGSGAEMMQPMAVVIVGGLTYATFLTLFIVPVLYDLLSREKPRVEASDD